MERILLHKLQRESTFVDSSFVGRGPFVVDVQRPGTAGEGDAELDDDLLAFASPASESDDASRVQADASGAAVEVADYGDTSVVDPNAEFGLESAGGADADWDEDLAGGEPSTTRKQAGGLPRRVWFVVGGLAALVLVVGVAFMVTSGGGEGATSGSSGPQAGFAGPLQVDAQGVPWGFAPTEDGAAAAAAWFSTLNQTPLIRDEVAFREAAKSVAAPGAEGEWLTGAERTIARYRDLQAELGTPDVEVRLYPLAVDVVEFSPDQATVQVWTLSIRSAAGKPGKSNYVAFTLTLDRIELPDGTTDWRANELTATTGVDPRETPEIPAEMSWDDVLRDLHVRQEQEAQ